MADQVLSGAASGAAKGFAVGGPVGAFVGGLLGGLGGLFKNKSNKYKRKANKEEQRMIEIQQSIQRRQLVRSIFLARSEAVAAAGAQETGGLQSSAARGAISSVGSQGISNLKTFDALVARDIMKRYYLKKAGKNAEYSGMISGFTELASGISSSFRTSTVSPRDATEANNSRVPDYNNEFDV